MSKQEDKRWAAKILREGFVLPERVEQFFANAKARAVKSVSEARKIGQDKMKDFYQNSKAMYDALTEEQRTSKKWDWRNGVYVTRELSYIEWYDKTHQAIAKEIPFFGFDDVKAIEIVEESCDMKRIEFIIRVYRIVGQNIADHQLYIDYKSGNVNGTITGSNGRTASVKTIGAGGYNIQCYHFRCLVHEIRPQ